MQDAATRAAIEAARRWYKAREGQHNAYNADSDLWESLKSARTPAQVAARIRAHHIKVGDYDSSSSIYSQVSAAANAASGYPFSPNYTAPSANSNTSSGTSTTLNVGGSTLSPNNTRPGTGTAPLGIGAIPNIPGNPPTTPGAGDGGGGGDGGDGGGGAPAAPAAPVDPRTQAQREAEFYKALGDAQKAAAAGNPTPLRNFDRMFNISRPAAEYSQDFYHGPGQNGRIKAANALNVSDRVKSQIILEIQSGNGDSPSNLATWFQGGHPPSAAAVRLGNTKKGKIDQINALNVSNKLKSQIILEAQSGNGDSVSNLVTWFQGGNKPSPKASALGRTKEGKINLTKALNISQSNKNKIILEIQSGNGDSVSNLVTWFEGGNPQSPKALAMSNNKPPKVPAGTATANTQAERNPVSSSNNSQSKKEKRREERSQEAAVAGAQNESTPVRQVANTATGLQKEFPEHWGEPPAQQTRDMQQLPGGYGSGSGTLAKWIQENLDKDAATIDTEKEEKNKLASLPAQANEQARRVTDPATMAARKAAIESRLERIAAARKPYTDGPTSVVKGNDSLIPPPVAGANRTQNGLPGGR